MKEKIMKIIDTYGVLPQLKYFQSEVFELNEAIIKKEYNSLEIDDYETLLKEHIAEEIADVFVMLKQFQYYYGIKNQEIVDIVSYKIDRQIKRIELFDE